MGMRATVKQYSIIVRTRKKVKGRTKLEQEQIWNGFKVSISGGQQRCLWSATILGLWEAPIWNLFVNSRFPILMMNWPGNAHENLSSNFAKKYHERNQAHLGVYLRAAWLQTRGSEL